MKREIPARGRSLPLLLAEHRERLAGCRKCGHPDSVLPIVSNARAPRVMLVGQAPGKTEAADQRPFAGRAGRTLFRWLERAGVDERAARAHIYIGAITRCYPGPSASGRGDRVPSPRERELCAEWLDGELRIIRPALVIPVGRLAIDRFIGPLPLEQVIGQQFIVDHPGGRSAAIPLPHPSGASSWIHQSGHGALLEEALRLLRRALDRCGVPMAPAAARARRAPPVGAGRRPARGVA
jgi:uracil-DNA glycosylase